MQFSFLEILTLILICLLFAKDYLPAVLKKFLGIETKNGNGFTEQLKAHNEQDKEDFGDVRMQLKDIFKQVSNDLPHQLNGLHEELDKIKEDIAYIRGVIDSKK